MELAIPTDLKRFFLLAEFNSVVDAVQCAVEVQRQLAERNAKIFNGRKMEYRIGVNLGDVIQEGKKIYKQ